MSSATRHYSSLLPGGGALEASFRASTADAPGELELLLLPRFDAPKSTPASTDATQWLESIANDGPIFGGVSCPERIREELIQKFPLGLDASLKEGFADRLIRQVASLVYSLYVYNRSLGEEGCDASAVFCSTAELIQGLEDRCRDLDVKKLLRLVEQFATYPLRFTDADLNQLSEVIRDVSLTFEYAGATDPVMNEILNDLFDMIFSTMEDRGLISKQKVSRYS